MSNPERQNGNDKTEAQDQEPRESEDTSTRAATSQENSDRKGGSRGPSLYDDALSERTTQKMGKFPVWPVVFGLVIAGMVFSFVSQPSSLEQAGQVGTEGQESELAKVVEDVHSQDLEGGEGEGLGSQAAATEPSSSSSEPKPEPEAEPVQEQPASSSSNRIPAVADPDPPEDPPATTVRNEAPAERVEDSARTETPPLESATNSRDEVVESPIEPEEVLDPEEAATEPEPDPGPPPEVQEAFDRLLRESEVAGKLAWGEYTTLEFIDWRVVQQTDREIWFDLTGKWTGNDQEVHFIWSVNTEDGKVKALSQEARNLEASARNQ